jgi:hypothetical protein
LTNGNAKSEPKSQGVVIRDFGRFEVHLVGNARIEMIQDQEIRKYGGIESPMEHFSLIGFNVNNEED